MNSADKPLITFDLGGVIVRTSSSIEEAAARAGVQLRAGKSDQKRWSALFVQWQTGQVSDSDFFDQWAQCVGRFEASDAAKISIGWLQGEYEGMAELLGELSAQGLPLGCLSNTSGHHWDYMLADHTLFPSLVFLTHRHASHLIGVMKPEETIYRAYEKLTGFCSERIVFFDDLQANVEAARRCGWQAERIDPRHNPALQVRAYLRTAGILTPCPRP